MEVSGASDVRPPAADLQALRLPIAPPRPDGDVPPAPDLKERYVGPTGTCSPPLPPVISRVSDAAPPPPTVTRDDPLHRAADEAGNVAVGANQTLLMEPADNVLTRAALVAQRTQALQRFSQILDALPQGIKEAVQPLLYYSTMQVYGGPQPPPAQIDHWFVFAGEAKKLALATLSAEDVAQRLQAAGQPVDRSALLTSEAKHQAGAFAMGTCLQPGEHDTAAARAEEEARRLEATGQIVSRPALLVQQMEALMHPQHTDLVTQNFLNQPITRLIYGHPDILAEVVPVMADSKVPLTQLLAAANQVQQAFLAAASV